jgi:ACS family glucarate transporter-like MFS transporter
MGWKACFWFEGLIGLVLAMLWFTTVHGVNAHPRISHAEIQYIESGGGLASIDAGKRPPGTTLTKALLSTASPRSHGSS